MPSSSTASSSSSQLAKSLDRNAKGTGSSSISSSGATVSSGGSKSPHKNKTKMMILAQPSSNNATSEPQLPAPAIRKRMGRRASTDLDPPNLNQLRGPLHRTPSSDTYGFNADDWQDSFTEDGGFLDDPHSHVHPDDDSPTTKTSSSAVVDDSSVASNGFAKPKTAIKPLTRKVEAKDANWFSEWESDFDNDDKDEKKKDDIRRDTQQKKFQSKPDKGNLPRAPSHGNKSESSAAPTRATQQHSSSSKSRDMDSSRRGGGSKNDDHGMDTSRRGNTSSSSHKNVSPQKQRSSTSSKRRTVDGGDNDDGCDSDLDSSRRGRKSSESRARGGGRSGGDGDSHDDMDTSRRGRKSSPHKSTTSKSLTTGSRTTHEDEDMDSSRRGRKASPHKKSSNHTSSRDRDRDDDMDSSRRGNSNSNSNSSSKSTAAGKVKKSIVSDDDNDPDDDMDSSRRGSRRGGSDILQRRNMRRSNSADESDDVSVAESTASSKVERVSRLTALRRASVAGGTVEDASSVRGRRATLEDDASCSSRPMRRASTSVSRRASVAGCGPSSARTGRDSERREDDGVRTRSRSRRASTRGKKLEKPPACKEKSFLGDRDDSEQAEEDDIEALFKQAHEKERQDMLDKSRVGPVRALERHGDDDSEDDDDDDDRDSPVHKRKASGYLPGNLNDTANHSSKGKSKPRRANGEKSSRRGSLDDLFNMDSQPNLLSSSASVQPDGTSGTGRYNPANVDNYFSSSSSVPGDAGARSGSKTSPGEWARDVDQLLGARRRAHGAESPRSHKGQLYGSTPASAAAATVVSVEYANKMKQLQQAKSVRGSAALGGPGGKPPAASDFILPMLVTPAEKTKKKNPLSLGLRRSHAS